MQVEWCSWELVPGQCQVCEARLWVIWALRLSGSGELLTVRTRWCRTCAPDVEGSNLELVVAVEPRAAEFMVWHRAAVLDHATLTTLGFWLACLDQLEPINPIPAGGSVSTTCTLASSSSRSRSTQSP